MTTAKHRLWTKKVKNAIRKDSVFDWRVQGSGFRVSLWGAPSFDYMLKRFRGLNGFNGGGAAHKNMEAPRSIDGGDARRWHFSQQ